jgi:hypothetical protein
LLIFQIIPLNLSALAPTLTAFFCIICSFFWSCCVLFSCRLVFFSFIVSVHVVVTIVSEEPSSVVDVSSWANVNAVKLAPNKIANKSSFFIMKEISK